MRPEVQVLRNSPPILPKRLRQQPYPPFGLRQVVVFEIDVEQVDVPRQFDIVRDVGFDDLPCDGQRRVLRRVVNVAVAGMAEFVVLLADEYAKLRNASNRDVHDTSKTTTLPIAREIVETDVMDAVKLPRYIDLLNINLENRNLAEAKRRIRLLAEAFRKDGTRITENLDFGG